MTCVDYIDYLIETAMKNKDTDMLSLFRMIKSEFVKYMKDKQVEAGAVDTNSIYKTMKKHLLEEIESLEKADRDTSVQRKHLDWVTDQLPKEATKEEIEYCIKDWLERFPDTANIGNTMAHVKLEFQDKTLDMKMVSQLVKEMLNK